MVDFLPKVKVELVVQDEDPMPAWKPSRTQRVPARSAMARSSSARWNASFVFVLVKRTKTRSDVVDVPCDEQQESVVLMSLYRIGVVAACFDGTHRVQYLAAGPAGKPVQIFREKT